MNAHNKIFGRVLKEYRNARGLSQEGLGFEANLSRTFISLLENGDRSPTLDTIYFLSKALNVTVPEFISRVDTLTREIE